MSDIISQVLEKENESEKILEEARLKAAEINRDAEKKCSLRIKEIKEQIRKDFNNSFDDLQQQQDQRLSLELNEELEKLEQKEQQLKKNTPQLIDELAEVILSVDLD